MEFVQVGGHAARLQAVYGGRADATLINTITLYAIPRIALVPLIILWAGLEFTGKVTILVSVAVFPIIVNTYAGIRDVRGSMLEIGRAYGATDTQIFFKIIMPAAIPSSWPGCGYR
jgi:ABC-type nitrate/sulfonate/bicarbonate transport system permease component